MEILKEIIAIKLNSQVETISARCQEQRPPIDVISSSHNLAARVKIRSHFEGGLFLRIR
jgi:hypothetical protein